MLFRTCLVIVLHNKGVPAQAPVLSFCRLETTALTMYFAPITGAIAGLPSNFGIQGPAAGSWPQLGIHKVPELDHGLILQFRVLELLIFSFEIRREGQLRRRDPSTDTGALEHRLRRKRRERPAAQKSPVANDATRPVPSGGTEQSKGRSGRPAHLREEDPGSPRRGSDDRTRELDIVMPLVADELDPEMNPEEIPLSIEAAITPGSPPPSCQGWRS